MTKQYTTILLVPCFNEALRINAADFQAFAGRHPQHLLLFVNDGSTDNTEAVLQQMQTQSGNIAYHTYAVNQGKGEAVRSGVQYALQQYDFTYIGFIDADLSTPLNEFLALQQAVEQNTQLQMAMGARVQMLGKHIKRNLFRHWFSRIIATLICKVLDEPVYDTQCGAKLFTRRAAIDLFGEKFLSKWLFDVELLARHKRKYGADLFKTTIIEMPVSNWTEKEDSKLRYHHVFRILLDLSKINKHYF